MWKTVLMASALLMVVGVLGFITSYAAMVVIGTKSGAIAKSYSDHPEWMFGGTRVARFALVGHPHRALVSGIFRLSAVLAILGIVGIGVANKRARRERAEQQSSSQQ